MSKIISLKQAKDYIEQLNVFIDFLVEENLMLKEKLEPVKKEKKDWTNTLPVNNVYDDATEKQLSYIKSIERKTGIQFEGKNKMEACYYINQFKSGLLDENFSLTNMAKLYYDEVEKLPKGVL